MAKGVSINDMASELSNMLMLYASEATEKIKVAAHEVASECVNEIKANSPTGKSRKHYKSGWSIKKAFEDPFEARWTAYNKNKPQLTHLLEYGHAGPKPAPAHPHIRPAEQKAIKKFEKMVEKAVKG